MASRLRAHAPILVVLALAIALSSACDNTAGAVPGDGTTAPRPTETRDVPATPTPRETSTPVPVGERDGADGLRAFAAQVQAAFDRSDAAFLRERMKTVDATCTAIDVGRRVPPGIPPCPAVGAAFPGFRAGAWKSEWYTVHVDEAFGTIAQIVETAEPTARDMLGSGELRVEALNVVPGEYRVIATAIALRPAGDPRVGPDRVSLSLTAAFENGQWWFTSLLSAAVRAEDLLRPGTEFTSRLTGWEVYRP